MRTLGASAVAAACGALLAACGGGGDGGAGTKAQSVDFPYPGTRYLLNAPAPLTASASSGLAVTFTSNTPSICTIDGGNLVAVAAGECSVTASQDGNSEFEAASSQQLFKVLKHPQAISFASPGFQPLDAGVVTLAATADSSLAVSFSSTTPDVCTVNGTQLTLVSKGQCSVTASQPGNDSYDAAQPKSVVFTVGDAPPPVLTLLSGFASTGSTTEGGSISTYAGSNKDGWWCSDPNWCGSALNADGSFTYHYWIQPNDPKHPNTDNWMSGYFGFQVMAPGVGSISSSGNTTTGVQVEKQTTIKFSVAENSEWFGNSNKDVRVILVLGHFNLKNNGACNIAVSTTFTPDTAALKSYELNLSSFSAFAESCNLSGLNATTELLTYPIVQVKFEAASANTSTSRSTDPANPSYPTELTLKGPVTVQ